MSSSNKRTSFPSKEASVKPMLGETGLPIPQFLTKTYEIFTSPEHQEYCCWGPKGDTIIIKKIEPFARLVLPKFFKHSNFQSFVRQLNMYDFRKTLQDPSHGEFAHPHFRLNRLDLLAHIHRKVHHKEGGPGKKGGEGGGKAEGEKAAKKKRRHVDSDDEDDGEGDLDDEDLTDAPRPRARPRPRPRHTPSLRQSAYTDGDELLLLGDEGLDLYGSGTPRSMPMDGGGAMGSLGPLSLTKDEVQTRRGSVSRQIINTETDAVLCDLAYQRALRGEFESRLSELESEQEVLKSENQALRQMMLDSRTKQEKMQERMNHVLRTLFNIFSGFSGGVGGVNAPGIGNGTTNGITNGAGANNKNVLSILQSGSFGQAGASSSSSSNVSGNVLDILGNGISNLIASSQALGLPYSGNPIELISTLGESNFMDVVGYLEMESPVASKSNSSIGGNAFGGATLCRLPSFEEAASNVTAPIIPHRSGMPGAPLDRMTSLDWPSYSYGPSSTPRVNSGGSTYLLGTLNNSSQGSSAGIAAVADAGNKQRGIEILPDDAGKKEGEKQDNKRPKLALMIPEAPLGPPLAPQVHGNGAMPTRSVGRPPLLSSSRTPRRGSSVPATIEKAIGVERGAILNDDSVDPSNIAQLLDQSQSVTISRINSLEATIHDILNNIDSVSQ